MLYEVITNNVYRQMNITKEQRFGIISSIIFLLTFTGLFVITSYSIHYTKLYEHYYLPSQFGSPSHNDTVSRFQFFIRADYPQPITEIFFPEISISSGSYIEGEYNAIEKKLWSRVLVHNFRYKDKEIESFELLSQNIDSSFYINIV